MRRRRMSKLLVVQMAFNDSNSASQRGENQVFERMMPTLLLSGSKASAHPRRPSNALQKVRAKRWMYLRAVSARNPP